MSYPLILLLSAGAGFVVSVLTAGGIVWRGVFVIGRWFGETNTTLKALTAKVDHQGAVLDGQSIQLGRMDERLEALSDRLERGGL